MGTGEVLDYHIPSKECRKCLLKKSQCQSEQTEHLASNDCDINFKGRLICNGSGGCYSFVDQIHSATQPKVQVDGF